MDSTKFIFNPNNTKIENELLELISVKRNGSVYIVLLDNKIIYKNSVRANCLEWIDCNFNNNYIYYNY